MIGYGVEGSRKVRIFSMSRILPYTGELDLKLGGVTDLVSPFILPRPKCQSKCQRSLYQTCNKNTQVRRGKLS